MQNNFIKKLLIMAEGHDHLLWQEVGLVFIIPDCLTKVHGLNYTRDKYQYL